MKKLFTLLGIALCAIGVHATPVTIRPGLTLDQGNGVYYIHYEVPEDYIVTTDTIISEGAIGDPALNQLSCDASEQYYSSIKFPSGDYYDYLCEDGRPQLPFHALFLLLSGNINVDVLNIDTIITPLPYPYLPAQMGSKHTGCISFDANYYDNYDDTWYWDDYATETIKYRFIDGLVFSFYPFHYEPLSQKLTIVTKADFAIYYDGTTIDGDYLDDILDEDFTAYRYFDNFIGYPVPQPYINDNYLIVVGDHWENETALADFVAHKENLGYNVTVAALHEIGDTPDDIRNYIKMHFETYHTKFVLLVGDVDEIPFYDGVQVTTTDPPSDIYYACLSKNSISQQYLDFSPSVFLGRWPIQTSTQLRNVVDKTIASDLHLGESNPETYRIELFSGTGNSYQSNAMYNDCKHIYNNIVQEYSHFSGDVHDGRDYQTQFAANIDVKTTLESDDPPTWMFVYEGYGTSDAIDEPYYFAHSQINSAQNSTLDFQPFGFGFADLLGNIFANNNFAREWLTSTEGGVTFLGATTETGLVLDRYFSREIFNQLDNEQKPVMTIGELVGNAKARYYNCDHVVWRRRQAKKYVLYGDPSLYLFGIDMNYNLPFGVKSHPHNPNEENKLTDGMENVISIQIYSVTGQLVRSCDNEELNLQGLPAGTYLLVMQTSDNVITKKIVIE